MVFSNTLLISELFIVWTNLKLYFIIGRCKGAENKWYIQVFYTFMKDFCDFYYTFMNDFCSFYYTFMKDFFEDYTLLWTTFWVLTKYEGKFLRQLLTYGEAVRSSECEIRIKIDNYWQFENVFCCGLVCLAPARCAHGVIVRGSAEIKHLNKSYCALSAVVSTLYDTTL